MKLRQQLPVLSPIEPSALVAALAPTLTASAAPLHALSATLRERHGATTVVLTDSGTSALIVALRITAGKGGTVAFPGYACIDLAAAARFANVKVRLYDVEPSTLSPDLDSLRATLRRGVNAVVVAHLFGYPADIPAVTALAREEGVAVIEDAAQAAGGTLHGKKLGSLGALSLLSFGRGKGMTGGNGGALMATDPEWNRALGDAGAALGSLRAGWADLAVATAQWTLGRPAIYGIPASVPVLHLGEMIYHPAHEPRAISAAAAALVRRAIRGAERELKSRRRNAERLTLAAREARGLRPVKPLDGGAPGYLRLPVLDSAGRSAAPLLGVLRPYPGTLSDQEPLHPALHQGETAGPGARQLGSCLYTLPTHSLTTERDLRALEAWLTAGAAVRAGRAG